MQGHHFDLMSRHIMLESFCNIIFWGKLIRENTRRCKSKELQRCEICDWRLPANSLAISALHWLCAMHWDVLQWLHCNAMVAMRWNSLQCNEQWTLIANKTRNSALNVRCWLPVSKQLCFHVVVMPSEIERSKLFSNFNWIQKLTGHFVVILTEVFHTQIETSKILQLLHLSPPN